MNGKNLEDLVMETLPIKFKAHEQEIEYLCASVASQNVVSCDLQGNYFIYKIYRPELENLISFIEKIN